MTMDLRQCFEQSTLPTSKWDTYFDAYEALLAGFRQRSVVFVEVGVLGGGSLEAWRRYFGPAARIIGVDLNARLKPFLESRGFEIHVGDQADPAFWEAFYRMVGPIDVLIDDGGHLNRQVWTTVGCTLPHVKDGGLVIIEDAHASYLSAFGNPARSSPVSRAFALVHEINYRSSRIGEGDRASRAADPEIAALATHVHSVRFYESIIALCVDRRLVRASRRADFGAARNLPDGAVPEDLRNAGLDRPDDVRGGVLRRLLNAIRRKCRRCA